MLFPGGGRGGRRAWRPGSKRAVTSHGLALRADGRVSGVLVYMDDFVVTLQDASGMSAHVQADAGAEGARRPIRSQAHHALLDTITDKNIHDLVAYLETLK